MSLLKRFGRSPCALALAGEVLAFYLRLVARTGRLVDGSPDFRRRVRAEGLSPFIAVTWHGEHFLGHLARAPGEDMRVLVSRHGDGEINAVAMRRLGLGLVRGSGGSGAKIRKRGGISALRELLRALSEGASVVFTADVPKVAKRVGEGTITLARLSGRPVLPFAVVGRRHVRLASWDRAALVLPFSRIALVVGDPVSVPRDADEAMQARLRDVIETSLNDVHSRAYALVQSRTPAASAVDSASS